MESFLAGNQPVAFSVASNKDGRYRFVEGILKRFAYSQLKRHEKGIVIQLLIKVTGYSRQKITRVIARYSRCGVLRRFQKKVNRFEKRYTTVSKKFFKTLCFHIFIICVKCGASVNKNQVAKLMLFISSHRF